MDASKAPASQNCESQVPAKTDGKDCSPEAVSSKDKEEQQIQSTFDRADKASLEFWRKARGWYNQKGPIPQAQKP